MSGLRIPCVLGTLLAGALPAQEARPNIVFVLADDVGWTDVSGGRTNRGNGSDYYRTPNIDALAARGVAFDNAYTCGPNCAPTRAALMSGLFAARTRVYTVFGTPPDGNRRLDPATSRPFLPLQLVTVAERIQDEGYTTGHFGKWNLGDDAYGPLGQGYDVNVGGTGAASVTGGSDGHFARGDGSWADLPGLPANGVPAQFMADRLTDEAIAWMDASKDRPFFCWLAHFSVHVPIQAPAADVAAFDGVPPGRHHRDQVYAGMLKNLDDSVGRIVGFLEDTDDPRCPGHRLIDDTIVIFTSDNGGLGGYASAGIVGAEEVTHNAPLRAGKGSLYEGGIRVPLIVRWDSELTPGTVHSVPVQSVDFADTLAHMAGALVSGEPWLDGRDLVPFLRGEVPGLERTSLFWHFPAYVVASEVLGTWIETPASAVRHDDWKLRFAYETRTWELYHLATDPGESVDLVGVRTDVAVELATELRDWLLQTGAALPLVKGTNVAVPLPGAPGAGDFVDWRLLAPAVAPQPVDATAAAAVADGVLLFGGETAAGVSDALWRFDGQAWQMLAPAQRPDARRGHAACADATGTRMLLFGGSDAGGTLLADTWLLDGTDAQRLPAPGAPPPREASALVFDRTRGVAVLFGGRGDAGPLDDTWEFDGVVWRQRLGATHPPARSGHGMVFDPVTGRICLFGGTANGAPLADTWIFDGSDWRELTLGSTPPARAAFAFAWDTVRHRAVLFGGRDADDLALADTWEFDGAQWRARTPAQPPLALAGAAAVFDRGAERILLVGGRNGARFAATWEYAPVFAARADAFGTGCPGSVGTPVLAPGARPWLGSALTADLAPLPDGGAAALLLGFSDSSWAGGSLPFSLAVLGAPDCWLSVAPDVVLALAAAAGRASVRVAVPASAALLGESFFVQGLATDPTANALGIVVSDAIAARIGAR